MNNMGQKIKELRKKNDLTQEKLADYLGVTYQAVSKWETGVAYPDLSMIVPLSKLLHVTTDELLGATDKSDDERKAFFDAEYHQYWLKEDHEADMELAKQALCEYPEEFKYLDWLAHVEWYVGYSVKYYGTDKFYELMESSIKHFQRILEDCKDESLRSSAISGIVWAYSSMERYDEARKYAEMYPEALDETRDEVLARCVKGEELFAIRRKITFDKLQKLCESLQRMRYEPFVPEAANVEEAVINAVITDGNYVNFHHNLFFIYMNRAERTVNATDYDGAVKLLVQAKNHAIECDRLEKDGKGEYTCPVLRGHTVDFSKNRDIGTLIDFFEDTVSEEAVYAPLRDRADFQMLLR